MHDVFWIDHVWSSKQCVCCACDPSVRLDSRCYFYMFASVFVCRKLSPHLRVWITGVCSSYDVSLCEFAYYVVG